MPKLITFTFLLAFLVGCATSRISPSTNLHRQESSFPEPGEVVTKRVGNQIANQETLTVTSALRITKQVVFGKEEGAGSLVTCGIAAPAGTWAFSGIYEIGQYKADCFGPVEMNAANADGSTNWNCGYDLERSICRDKDAQYFVVIPLGRWILKQDASMLSVVPINVKSDTDSSRELIYGGRNGNRAIFTYREYLGDLSKPVFKEESQHELGDTAIFDIHGFRITVLRATELEISYELLRISPSDLVIEK